MGFFKGILRLIPTVLVHVAIFIVVDLLGTWFSDDSSVTGFDGDADYRPARSLRCQSGFV